ncbi:multiheme c-type cytochrome [Rhodopirellula sallentina]|uniref:multiheme c-type cytochrome n=1 Tax=Rhodopirellula sallentina TaxID=1263869 RepID=UPI001F47B206|nr:multiheme c-type cytochrome [Rhodopirellula sallentina]
MTTWRHFVASKFAGDQACATCHRAEYDAHQRSGHSRTLTLIPQSDLASELSQLKNYSDARRNQEFAFDATEDRFIVRDEANAPGVSVPVTWLLGSGMHAQTPIAVDEHTQTGVELRWSSFPSQEKIGVTPDHERFDDIQRGTIECFGRPLDGSDIRACLGCHSTVTSPPSLPILQSLVIANVGCERCHGPRQDHVSLAHQGFAEEAKPMMRYETAESYMDTCAACHRDETSVRADAKPHELARFQPYGITRSQCYLETPVNLTCSTCHDPHDTVSNDRSESIEQCQQCHGDNSHTDLRAFHKTVAVCTHEPDGGCIECHMPSVAWAEGISFRDHRIRIP